MAHRILLCDDSEFYLQSISLILQEMGYEVVSTTGGAKALEALRSSQYLETGGFNLILCDVMMPEMGGFDVLKEVKNDPALQHIPFIFLSFVSDMESIDRAAGLGVQDYFIKSEATLERIGELVSKYLK